MSHSDISLLVTALASLAPGFLALLLATSSYMASHNAANRIRLNTARLDSLENGGGDRKIDARLAQIGLVDRREVGGVPIPVKAAGGAPVGQGGAANGI